MSRIEKKLWKEYFDQVASGKKKYELRLNDFDVAEGDTLILREWDKERGEYTGRTLEKQVTRVNRFKLDDLYAFWSKADIEDKGIQIISLDEL
jgi:ASC-1-like (ASCH) protein